MKRKKEEISKMKKKEISKNIWQKMCQKIYMKMKVFEFPEIDVWVDKNEREKEEIIGK